MSSSLCTSSRKLLFFSISVIRRGGRAENGSEAFNVRVSGQRRQTVCRQCADSVQGSSSKPYSYNVMTCQQVSFVRRI